MRLRRGLERIRASLRPAGLAVAGGFLFASSNLQETNDLVWTMVAIGVAGSIVTFSFLVYSIWRFRDPKAKGRRHG